MDIVWERKRYFNDTLKDCENGAVVLLENYQNFGPFLVIGYDNHLYAGKILLFDFSDNFSTFFDADERVEVLEAELHLR